MKKTKLRKYEQLELDFSPAKTVLEQVIQHYSNWDFYDTRISFNWPGFPETNLIWGIIPSLADSSPRYVWDYIREDSTHADM